MRALFFRDIRLSLDRGWGWLSGVIFYIAFIAIVALAVGGSAPVLTAIGPGLAWSGILFGILLGAPSLFSDDIRNGALDGLRLHGHGLASIVGARMLSLAVLTLLPLLIGTFAIGQLLFLDMDRLTRLVASIFVAAPALAGYAAFSGALMARRGAGGFVGILVTLPWLAPVLIFGTAAVSTDGPIWAAPEIRALVGLSLIGGTVGLFGAVAALRTNGE